MTRETCSACGCPHSSETYGTSFGGVWRVATRCADCGVVDIATRQLRRPVVVARCRCGAQYDVKDWLARPLVGPQDDGDGGVLELRNCVCGSTIASRVMYEVPR